MRIRTRTYWTNIGIATLIGVATATTWLSFRDSRSAATQPNDWGTPVRIDTHTGLDQQQIDTRINQGCKIATFGIHPWLPPGKPHSDAWARDTGRALHLMGMPAEAITLAVAKMRDGKPDEPFGMGDTHGVGTHSGQLYYPSMMTTYRTGGEPHVCLDSHTAFNNDQRSEFGMMFRVTDKQGKVWHVGEFVACGNVTLFTPGAPGWIPYPGWPNGLLEKPAPGASGPGAAPGGAMSVPEPGSFLLVVLALLCVLCVWRVKKPNDKE